MTTTRDIIERALRMIGVVAADEAMTADQADNGLGALNDMMHGWSAQGIDYAHTDLEISDPFPMDAKWRGATVALLAQRLGPDYLVMAPDADASLRQLQAGFMTIPVASVPSALLRTSSQDDL